MDLLIDTVIVDEIVVGQDTDGGWYRVGRAKFTIRGIANFLLTLEGSVHIQFFRKEIWRPIRRCCDHSIKH